MEPESEPREAEDAMGPFSEPFRRELLRLFRLRRDVRRFKRDPLPEEEVMAVLEAAHLAPSVGLSQPWRFVRVRSEPARAAVIASFERANAAASAAYDDERGRLYRSLKLAGLREAPEHLLVCFQADTTQGHGLGRATLPGTLRDSVICAIQNLWLAARARGLAIGWVSILDPEELRRPLNLPDNWQWVAYLCLGLPERDQDHPELEAAGWEQRRPLDEVVFTR
ncbi:MAG: 5,6-dimethylbenzimidazole synthase [Holophaga sp.]|jgi:5,6-dimethylbenzimidazole synthase